ncbi:MAG: HEAT repeat domain-containing protein, partial [Myxococcales bacterium]
WTLALGSFLALLTLAGCQRERENVLKEIQSPARPAQRAAAVARLADHVQEEDLALLLKLVHDESALVRRSAAQVLTKFPAPQQVIDPLGELLGDPDEDVQAEAVLGLAAIKADKSRAYLLSAYVRRGGLTRAAIARALGSAGQADAVRNEAKSLWDRNLKVLESGAAAERIGAAEELGRSGRTEAVDRLLPLLGDDSVLLAAGAARGLGAARDRRAVQPLLGILKENYPQLREAAAESLGLLGEGAAAVPALEKLALDGGQVSIPATKALGELRAADAAREALCRLTVAGAEDVASYAGRLMREHGCPTAPLLARLAKGGADARAAMMALGGLGVADGAAKVFAYADHADPGLRLLAAQTLGELKAEEIAPRLLERLGNETARHTRRREKWAKQPLPKQFAPGFGDGDDDGHGHGHGEHGDTRDRRVQGLLTQIDELKKKRMEAAGLKYVPQEEAVQELTPDLQAEELEFTAALMVAAGRLRL